MPSDVPPSYLAIDLGASTGRAVLGTLERLPQGWRVATREVHRFRVPMIEEAGHLYWQVDALWADLRTALATALDMAPTLQSVSVDSWAVDYVPGCAGRGTRRGGGAAGRPHRGGRSRPPSCRRTQTAALEPCRARWRARCAGQPTTRPPASTGAPPPRSSGRGSGAPHGSRPAIPAAVARVSRAPRGRSTRRGRSPDRWGAAAPRPTGSAAGRSRCRSALPSRAPDSPTRGTRARGRAPRQRADALPPPAGARPSRTRP